eukprot:666500-Prymnesium_polylepis.1
MSGFFAAGDPLATLAALVGELPSSAPAEEIAHAEVHGEGPGHRVSSPQTADELLQQILNEGHVEPEPRHASPRLRREELDLLLRRADEALDSPRNSCSASEPPTVDGALPATSTTLSAEDARAGGEGEEEARRPPSLPADSDAIGAANQPSASASSGAVRTGAEALRGIAAAEAELHSLRSCGDRRVLSPLREQHGTDRRQRLGLLKLETLEGINATLRAERTVRTSGRPTAIALHPQCIAVGTSFGHVHIFDRKDQALRITLGVEPGTGASAPGAPLGNARARTGGAARMIQGLSAAAVAATLSAGAVTSASTISSLERDRDALTALQLAEGSDLLLAGHASGRVVLWDVAVRAQRSREGRRERESQRVG